MTTHDAIARSVSHNEIVTIPYSTEAADALWAECDDHVDARASYGVVEYWGTTDDGDEWRVHLRDEAVVR